MKGHIFQERSPQISSSNIVRRIRKQVDDGAHKILRGTHLTLRNQGDPLRLKIWVIVQNLLRPSQSSQLCSSPANLRDDNSQCSQHVPRADAVDPDVRMRPFDRQATGQMSDSSLGSIVWRLRLRHVDDRTGHRSDHDDAALGLALHQMPRKSGCAQVGAVDVDAPQFLNAVEGVTDCVEVLRESGGRHHAVDFAMLFDDGCHRAIDGIGGGDVAGVGCDAGVSRHGR